MKRKEFNKVAVIGLGLIGGSLAWALKKSGRIGNVTGIDTDGDSIDFAVSEKIIDEGYTGLSRGISDAGIIVIATNVGQIVKTGCSNLADVSRLHPKLDVVARRVHHILPD